jgi:hypothetical protein
MVFVQWEESETRTKGTIEYFLPGFGLRVVAGYLFSRSWLTDTTRMDAYVYSTVVVQETS